MTVRWGRTAGLAVWFGGMAALALWPVLWAEGWPYNHEKLAFAWRTLIQARHIQLGDWLPVWSSQDNFGFGSPLPILYHKLFTLLATVAYLASGKMKASLLCVLWALMVTGQAGLYRAARYLGAPLPTAAALAAMLVFANYTATNWLVRGAMAEFTAMMLVPFALWWSLVLIREGRWPVWIGPLLFFIYLSHSVMAYYMAWVLGLAVVVRLAGPGRTDGLRQMLPRAAASIGLFAVLLVPFGLPALVLSEGIDITRVLGRGYTPAFQLRPFAHYIVDPDWQWGQDWQGLTIQLDWAPLVLIAGLALVLLARRHRGTPRPMEAGPDRRIAFLSATLALLLVLQTPAALPFYAQVPGAAFIQFPWRLVGFMVPVLLLLAAALKTRSIGAGRVRASGGLAAAALAVTLLLYGGFRPLEYPWFPEMRIEGDLPADLFLGVVGEYLPRVTEPDAEKTFQTVKTWARSGGAEGPCRVEETGRDPGEVLVRTFSVDCPGSGTVRLPVFFSGADRGLRLTEAGNRPVRLFRTPADPRIAVDLEAGDHRIRVILPTFGSVFGG